MTKANGEQYIGKWKNSKRHGLGKMIWPARGISYEGEWKDDIRHGLGKMTWQDGFNVRWRFCKR